jgi:hypothetical protein
LSNHSGSVVKVVKPVPIGTFITDVVEKKRLICCPYYRYVLIGYAVAGGYHRAWNMCLLDSEHCPYHGKRVSFRVNHVVWRCPMIVALAGEEVVVSE